MSVMKLAHNDEDGMVYCNLCEWVGGPFYSFEMIEAKINDHLKDAHGKKMVCAVEDESGVVKQTPQ